MKKRIVLLVVAALLVLTIPGIGFAEEDTGWTVFEIDDQGNITVDGVVASDADIADIVITPKAVTGGYATISKSGTTYSATATTTYTTSAVLSVVVQIQKKSGSTWSNVSGASASKGATGKKVTVSVSKSLGAGTYRARGTHRAASELAFYSYSATA